ncbi:hypothetical protein [Streptomyces sp. NPDC002324]
MAKSAGASTFAFGFQPKTNVIDSLFSDLFDRVKAPLAPRLPQQAEKLADLLLPVNLQGFRMPSGSSSLASRPRTGSA